MWREKLDAIVGDEMRKLLIALAIVAAPAWARGSFEAYEGPNAEMAGQGGTKVSKDGFDYWTSGSPPRRFKILGALIDRRGTGPLGGQVAGSPSVAKRARAVGGDAVIIGASERRVVGMSDDPPSYGADGQMRSRGQSVDEKRETRVIVIKYLD